MYTPSHPNWKNDTFFKKEDSTVNAIDHEESVASHYACLPLEVADGGDANSYSKARYMCAQTVVFCTSNTLMINTQWANQIIDIGPCFPLVCGCAA